MKKTIKTLIITGANIMLLALLSLSVSAQKLANIQEGSVLAPANVKVDAKLNEWDTFQAYNKTTDIFYTMANDGDNLYFVMKSADQMNNNKIIGGGINLTINTSGKKNEKDAFALAFPVVNLANLRSTMMQGMRASSGGPGGAPDSDAIAQMRKKVVSTFKEIKLIGFKEIPDSVISIYNEYGIKAFVDFDNKGNLIVEMAVPLKLMNIVPGSAFAYNVKLNGINLNAIMPGAMTGGFGGGGMGGASFGGGGGNPQAVTVVSSGSMGGGGGVGMPRGMGDIANMFSPTDFWGKYTIAKK